MQRSLLVGTVVLAGLGAQVARADDSIENDVFLVEYDPQVGSLAVYVQGLKVVKGDYFWEAFGLMRETRVECPDAETLLLTTPHAQGASLRRVRLLDEGGRPVCRIEWDLLSQVALPSAAGYYAEIGLWLTSFLEDCPFSAQAGAAGAPPLTGILGQPPSPPKDAVRRIAIDTGIGRLTFDMAARPDREQAAGSEVWRKHVAGGKWYTFQPQLALQQGAWAQTIPGAGDWRLVNGYPAQPGDSVHLGCDILFEAEGRP